MTELCSGTIAAWHRFRLPNSRLEYLPIVSLIPDRLIDSLYEAVWPSTIEGSECKNLSEVHQFQ
jgi:hypothetical protein